MRSYKEREETGIITWNHDLKIICSLGMSSENWGHIGSTDECRFRVELMELAWYGEKKVKNGMWIVLPK